MKLTLASANSQLSKVHIKRTPFGEFRVSFKNDPKAEDKAYYTTDLTDAFGTGLAMERHALGISQ